MSTVIEIPIEEKISPLQIDTNTIPTFHSFECPICLIDEQGIEPFILSNCNHIFCGSCLKEYLNTQISSFKAHPIKCPQDGCTQIIQAEIIQKLLDQKDFDQYQRLISQKLNKRAQNKLMCPKSGCSRLITQSQNFLYTKCKCESLICNVCGNFWHEGKTCLEVIDPEFTSYSEKNELKFCVMCKTIMAKVDGCTHITCPICDYEWCWICGREYSKNHFSNCPSEWSPLPPKKVLRETYKLNIIRDTIIGIKELIWFILELPLRLIFWPFFIMNVRSEMRSPDRYGYEKFQLVFISTFYTIVYNFMNGIIIWLMARSENKIATILLGVVLFTTLLLPWSCRICGSLFRAKQTKRWMSRDSSNFGYTDANRPKEKTRNKVSPYREIEVKETEDKQIQKKNIFVDQKVHLRISSIDSQTVMINHTRQSSQRIDDHTTVVID